MSTPAEHGPPRAVVPQAQIRAALRADQLRLHYHRIVSLHDGTTRGVEALVRWQHPQGGLLPPDDFLPAVAHTPAIHEITRWVLLTALDALREWPPDWTMSVNISALDATHRDLLADVERGLRTSGIAPERLVLELTEQAMVQDLESAVKVLRSLRSLGVGLALDDFGTGYSSLLYLRDLPITELKIDRTFLARVTHGEEDLAIVKSVAQLGRAIGVHVVAEGIETLAQARAARAAGCHFAQGYLWGEPAAADQIDPDRVLAVPDKPGGRHRRTSPPRSLAAGRVQELVDEGASLHTIAAALNREGLRTDKQLRWTAPTVALVISRLPPKEELEAPG
jgi:EAL domain-containing protein (putative c-di-GMP-specific phosphodiesterase class I)